MEETIITRSWPVIIALVLLLGASAVYAGEDELTDEVKASESPRGPNQNLLTNPSFEGPYSPYIPPGGHPDCPAGICLTAQMAAGWTPYWKSHNPDDDPWIYRMPEYKPAELGLPGPLRVHDGQRAQQYFTFYSTHLAGFYQRVPVESGRNYCFTIWGHSWSSDNDDPYTSDSPLIQMVGIDPFGGVDWESEQIVWSPPYQQYNEYGLFAVCAEALGDHLTVFSRSEPEWAVKHNDVYWDDAQLFIYEHALEIPQGSELNFLVDVDLAGVLTRTVVIDLPDDPWVFWSAELTDSGDLAPVLINAGGSASEDLIITMDGTGRQVGVYSAAVTITTYPELEGSPIPITINLVVVPEIYLNSLSHLSHP